MNSTRGIIFYIFIIAANTIHCALGQYEPIVYYDAPESHYFSFQQVKYDSTNKHYEVIIAAEDDKIFIACPSQDTGNPNSLIIQKSEFGKAAVTPICENPVKSQIYFSNNQKNYSAVGFLIHTPALRWIHHFLDIPENHLVVGLIYFKFDVIFKRIKVLWYEIVGGKFLNPKISRQEDELWKYQKNENIYGYDIDPLYSQPGCPFVKVPLAPEEDFLFDNWKPASRQNVLTAPMWRDLQAQWRALEIFIRKVTRIVDSVTVTTGIKGRLLKQPHVSDNLSSEYVYLENETYRVPKYFWKSISMQFYFNNRRYSYGILFIMHNVNLSDPNSESDEQKICSDYDIAKLGWRFLKDDQFRSPMYGCLFNNEVMSQFGKKVEGKFEDFNLNSLSVMEFDDNGKGTVGEVNVIEKIQQLEEEEAKKM